MTESSIYIPSEEKRDPAAEKSMQMGRVDIDPENALYDPWFRDSHEAQTWQLWNPREGCNHGV